jgi:23S rRNA pseudouridine955/2504/2580 synthase
MKTYKISKLEDGTNIQKWFKKNLDNVPFILIQKFFRKKLVKVNNKKINKDYILKAGDEIKIPSTEERLIKEKYKPNISREEYKKYFLDNIIYENDFIIVLNKPQGIASQGGSKVRLSIDYLSELYSENENEKPFIVHRLDKDTSGILILAKTKDVAVRLGEKFKNKQIEKTYLAIVIGKIIPMQGIINKKLTSTLGIGNFEKMIVADEGKSASTEYKVLEYYGKTASLVEVKPKTGRKHQIRVHMSSIGHPILGDGKYGGATAFIEGLTNKMCLHSWKIGKIEGVLEKEIVVKPPKHFDIDSEI